MAHWIPTPLVRQGFQFVPVLSRLPVRNNGGLGGRVFLSLQLFSTLTGLILAMCLPGTNRFQSDLDPALVSTVAPALFLDPGASGLLEAVVHIAASFWLPGEVDLLVVTADAFTVVNEAATLLGDVGPVFYHHTQTGAVIVERV